MKNLLLILFLLDCSFGFSQTTDFSAFEGKRVNISKMNSLEEPFFYIYKKKNGRSTYIIDKSSATLDNSAPENLIAQYYNCQTAGDVAKLIDQQHSSAFKSKLYVKDKGDTSKYCLWLVHKLTLKWHGYETAIVKFKEIKNDSITLSINTCQLINNNGWHLISDSSLADIEETVRWVLPNFFRQVSWTDYHSVDQEIVKYVVYENNANITRMHELILKYRKANDMERLKEFCDVIDE